MSPTSAPTPAAPSPTGPCILIVDDDRVTRLALSKPLQAKGYRVLEAGKLADAQTMIDGNEIKLLVVDGLMPDGTGLDFITGLRVRGVTAPVIFISSFSKHFQTQGISLQSLNVLGTLPKPVPMEQLLAMVHRGIGSGHVKPVVAAPGAPKAAPVGR